MTPVQPIERPGRPDLKTWRCLLAVELAVEASLAAAEAEDLLNLVGRPLREMGLYLAAALVNVETVAP